MTRVVLLGHATGHAAPYWQNPNIKPPHRVVIITKPKGDEHEQYTHTDK